MPRTHSIVDLTQLVEALEFPSKLAEKASLLDSLYLPTRYPDALPTRDALPGEPEAQEAIAIARKVLEWAKQAEKCNGGR